MKLAQRRRGGHTCSASSSSPRVFLDDAEYTRDFTDRQVEKLTYKLLGGGEQRSWDCCGRK